MLGGMSGIRKEILLGRPTSRVAVASSERLVIGSSVPVVVMPEPRNLQSLKVTPDKFINLAVTLLPLAYGRMSWKLMATLPQVVLTTRALPLL